MKTRLLTLFLVMAGSQGVLATGDPFAIYQCCKTFMAGNKPEGCGYSKDRCQLIISSMEQMIHEGQQLQRAYPGTGADLQVDNVAAEVKRSPAGHPLTVVVKYSIHARENWAGSGDLTPSEIGPLRLNDGRITPQPKVINEQIPYMYSHFGLEKNKTYLFEIEFVPEFLNGYKKPYMRLPTQWNILPCFITPSPYQKKYATDAAAPKIAVYKFELDFDKFSDNARRNSDYKQARFSKDLVLPSWQEFYKGHKAAGTPECVAKGAMQVHPENAKRMEQPY